MFAVSMRSALRRSMACSLRHASNQAPPPTQNSKPPAVSSASSLPSLDIGSPEIDQGAQRTGAKSSKDSLSSAERRRQRWGRASLAMMMLGLGAGMVYMGREWTEDELRAKKTKHVDALDTRFARTKERFTGLFNYFSEPAWPELLPPPLPSHLQKPYTLLLSIDDLLVTSTWDRQHGWRTAKRPGVDYFLKYISQFYEVVIFTTQHHHTATPILDQLDRYKFFISYKLFREATRSINGKVVKDLSYLNRDLSKVVCLDTDEGHVSTHPENAIVIPKWKGDPTDKGLIALIPFLESIGIYKPDDVRPILQAYRGKDIPIEYSKKEAEAKEKHIEEWRHKKKGIAGGGFTLSGIFGTNNNDSVHSLIPPTYLEQKRKEAQLQYMKEQRYIQTNKAYLEKLLELDQEAMAKEVPNNLWEAFRTMAAGETTSTGSEASSVQNSSSGSTSSSSSSVLPS